MAAPNGFTQPVNETLRRVTSERNNLPYRGAFFAKVISPAADEQVLVDSVVGRKTISYPYPFASTNSWIRGQPAAGTTVAAVIGSDSADLQPVAFIDPSKSLAAATYAKYAADLRVNPAVADQPVILPYRPVLPDEIDQGHRFAQLFFGQGDLYQARGGYSHFQMDSFGATTTTPLHVVESSHNAGVLNDELRHGVVRRSTQTADFAFPALIKPDGVNFGKEWALNLQWSGNPGTLVDFRYGTVVEDNGASALSPQGDTVRARERFFTPAGETQHVVDNSGNVFLTLSTDATRGYSMALPVGAYRAEAQSGEWFQSSQNDMTLKSNAGSMHVSSLLNFDITGQSNGEVRTQQDLLLHSQLGSTTLDGIPTSGVRLGLAASFPVMRGDPGYLGALNGLLVAEIAQAAALSAYGSAAATAWGAIGAITLVIDPSGVLFGLCTAAAGAAATTAAAAGGWTAALSTYQPTIRTGPGGLLSQKVVSE